MPDRLLPTTPAAGSPGMRNFWLTIAAALVLTVAGSYWTSTINMANVLYRLDKIEQNQERIATQSQEMLNMSNQNATKILLMEQQVKMIEQEQSRQRNGGK